MNRRSLLRFLGGAAVAPVVAPAVVAALPAAVDPKLYRGWKALDFSESYFFKSPVYIDRAARQAAYPPTCVFWDELSDIDADLYDRAIIGGRQ